MGSRVPKNGDPTSFWGGTRIGPGSQVPKNGEPARIRSSRSFENRVPIKKNPSGFRVLGNGEPIVDFAFPGSGFPGMEPETDAPS